MTTKTKDCNYKDYGDFKNEYSNDCGCDCGCDNSDDYNSQSNCPESIYSDYKLTPLESNHEEPTDNEPDHSKDSDSDHGNPNNIEYKGYESELDYLEPSPSESELKDDREPYYHGYEVEKPQDKEEQGGRELYEQEGPGLQEEDSVELEHVYNEELGSQEPKYEMDREDKGMEGGDFELQEHNFQEYPETAYEADYEEQERGPGFHQHEATIYEEHRDNSMSR